MQTLPVPQPLQAIEQRRPRALEVMAARLNVDPTKMLDTLKATVFKGATNEELLALVVTANEYHLNPFLRELYAFPGRQGGIVPIVSIDGWIKIVNRQAQFNGVQFEFVVDSDEKPVSCTATMHRKDHTHPTVITEYMSECSRNTEPWRQMPMRMLRHKAFIQAGRLAFGLSGIYDEDEARDFGVQLAASRPISVPDFSVQEPPTATPKTVTVSTPVQPVQNESPAQPEPQRRRGRPPKQQVQVTTETEKPAQDAPQQPPESKEGTPSTSEPAGECRTPQQELQAILGDAGVPFPEFQFSVAAQMPTAAEWKDWSSIPTEMAVKILKQPKLVAKILELFGKEDK